MERYVTVKEAAECLRISSRTIRRYLAEGLIAYTKPAGRILIKEADLYNFVNITR